MFVLKHLPPRTVTHHIMQRPSAKDLLRHPFVANVVKPEKWQELVKRKVQLMMQLQRELSGEDQVSGAA